MRLPRISAGELLRETRSRAVVFDMDGVLADTERFHLDAWHRIVLELTGREVPRDLVKGTFGQTNDAIIPILWSAVGSDAPRDVAAIGRRKEEIYRDSARGEVQPIAGLFRFLRWLRDRGVPAGIATSGPMANVRFLLDEFGIEDLFASIVDRAQFAAGKPAPDCFLKAAERLRARPERILVFEDSIHGLRSARRGGFPVCAVATTLPERALRLEARRVVRDFLDIAC